MKRKMFKWTCRMLLSAILISYVIPMAPAAAANSVTQAWDLLEDGSVPPGPGTIGEPPIYETGKTNVIHHLMFTTASQLDGSHSDTITITFPDPAFLNGWTTTNHVEVSYYVSDTPVPVTANAAAALNAVTISLDAAASIPAGAGVVILLKGMTNPPAPGYYQLLVNTSTDTTPVPVPLAIRSLPSNRDIAVTGTDAVNPTLAGQKIYINEVGVTPFLDGSERVYLIPLSAEAPFQANILMNAGVLEATFDFSSRPATEPVYFLVVEDSDGVYMQKVQLGPSGPPDTTPPTVDATKFSVAGDNADAPDTIVGAAHAIGEAGAQVFAQLWTDSNNNNTVDDGELGGLIFLGISNEDGSVTAAPIGSYHAGTYKFVITAKDAASNTSDADASAAITVELTQNSSVLIFQVDNGGGYTDASSDPNLRLDVFKTESVQFQVKYNNGYDLFAGSPYNPNTKFKISLNIGDYDPVTMSLTGDVISYTYALNPSGNTITVEAKARPSSWTIEECRIGACGDESTAATFDYAGMLIGSIHDMAQPPGIVDPQQIANFQNFKENSRGSWIATNAQSFSSAYLDDTTGAFTFDVAAPHFKVDSLTVNTGFFKAYLPDTLLHNYWGIADPSAVDGNSLTTKQTDGEVVTTVSPTVARFGSGVTVELDHFHYSSPKFSIDANAAPTATAVSITGTAQVGQTLTGTYTYNDAENDAEGTSTFKWYRGSQADGTGKALINGATAKTYTLVGADQGKYIFFEVTPVASAGTATGTPVVSGASALVAAQSGGEGGGGIPGPITPQPEPQPPVKETPSGVTLQPEALNEQYLNQAFDLLKNKQEDAQTITIPVTASGSEPAQVQIPAGALANAAAATPNAVVSVRSDTASFNLPVNAIDYAAIAQSMGASVSDLKLSIQMEPVAGDAADRIQEQADRLGLKIKSPIIDFKVTVQAEGKPAEEINNFGGTYVPRTLAVTELDGEKQLTAVVIDPKTGEMSFVPAVVTTVNGVARVVIMVPHNSIYAIVESTRSFDDIQTHWAKDDIALLASKLLMKGISEKEFAPDKRITRAEFAALLVRALGLAASDTASKFTDTASDEWYAASVNAAVKAGLISGYSDGTFRPNDAITREQMAVMVSKALKFASKSPDIGSRKDELLSAFKDLASIADWSRTATAELLEAGIMKGRKAAVFDPKAYATRGEAASILKKMLVYCGFINA